MKTWMDALGTCIAAGGSVGGGPVPDWGASPDTHCPDTILLIADRMRRRRRARNLRPGAGVLCDSASFISRSGVSGMTAFRHTFQQAVLPLWPDAAGGLPCATSSGHLWVPRSEAL